MWQKIKKKPKKPKFWSFEVFKVFFKNLGDFGISVEPVWYTWIYSAVETDSTHLAERIIDYYCMT